jgi:hypothetical protein
MQSHPNASSTRVSWHRVLPEVVEEKPAKRVSYVQDVGACTKKEYMDMIMVDPMLMGVKPIWTPNGDMFYVCERKAAPRIITIKAQEENPKWRSLLYAASDGNRQYKRDLVLHHYFHEHGPTLTAIRTASGAAPLDLPPGRQVPDANRQYARELELEGSTRSAKTTCLLHRREALFAASALSPPRRDPEDD